MDVQVAPLRAWDDFFPGTDRFSRPDLRDISKWNNRVVSNLLYYQTNYLALAAGVICLVGRLMATDQYNVFTVFDTQTEGTLQRRATWRSTANEYFASWAVMFLSPFNMILGGSVVILVFLGFVWTSHNKDFVRKFKKQYPTLFVMSIMLSSYFVISLFGGVMVFVFGITFPLLLMFIHASLRLRNMKNKMENKMEGIGLKRTPMGIVLDALEQQEENFTKIADYINKVKE